MNDRGPTFEDEFDDDERTVELETAGHGGDTESLQSVTSEVSSKQCTKDGSPNGNNVAVEQAWQNLMSAVPRAAYADGDNIRPAHDLSHAMPKPEAFDRVVRSIRPAGVADHAIDTIAGTWRDAIYRPLEELPGLLDVNVGHLAEEWVGDDFDAFSDVVAETVKIRSEEHTSELQSRGHLVCR